MADGDVGTRLADPPPDPDENGHLPPGWRWRTTSDDRFRNVDLSLARTIVYRAERCSCKGGWVEDEGWSPEYREQALASYQKTPGDGIVPCGFCNHGGWDAPWPPNDARSEGSDA